MQIALISTPVVIFRFPWFKENFGYFLDWEFNEMFSAQMTLKLNTHLNICIPSEVEV